jgi:hypothetical protein
MIRRADTDGNGRIPASRCGDGTFGFAALHHIP